MFKNITKSRHTYAKIISFSSTSKFVNPEPKDSRSIDVQLFDQNQKDVNMCVCVCEFSRTHTGEYYSTEAIDWSVSLSVGQLVGWLAAWLVRWMDGSQRSIAVICKPYGWDKF